MTDALHKTLYSILPFFYHAQKKEFKIIKIYS